MGRSKSLVMDGRDICTNVMPDAEFKFFITASAEEGQIADTRSL